MEPSAVQEKTGLLLNCAFSKVDEEKREVWGIATSEALDVQGEIVDFEGSKAAFAEWADQFSKVTNGESLGNIREMHQPRSVGRLIAWRPDEAARQIHVGVKLSRSPDGESAWQKVKERVLNGFSIGAPTAERVTEFKDGKARKRVVSYKLSELSLVDNPACPEAWINEVKLAKSAGVVGRMSLPAAVSGALEVITESAAPVAPRENAYVDPDGGVWQRIEGIFKKGEPMSEIAKAKNVTAHTRSEGKSPGVETPTVQGDPEPVHVGPKKVGGMEEASAVISGGPHDDASKPVSPPATQGKAAGDMAYGAAGGPPPPPQGQPQQAQPPQAAPAPAPMRYSYCAMCAGKLADGSAPIHQECGQPARPAAPPQQAPAPAAPPAPPAQGQPFQRTVTVATPDTTPVSVGDGQGKAAAAGLVGEIQKAFASSLDVLQKGVNAGFEKMSNDMSALAKRVETIERTPIPGGPSRTELPEGVTGVEKGGGAGAREVSDEAALTKAMEIIDDPMMKDRISQTLAKRAILKAQAGR